MARDMIRISIANADVGAFPADVIALKYAQGFHGADSAIASRLRAAGLSTAVRSMRLTPGESQVVPSHGAVSAPLVLFTGTPPLFDLGYEEIRKFGTDVIRSLGKLAPRARSLALTLHGPNYGLDEIEAFLAELAGVLAGLEMDPRRAVTAVTFVELMEARAPRLAAALRDHLDEYRGLEIMDHGPPEDGVIASFGLPLPTARDGAPPDSVDSHPDMASLPGTTSETKAHVFVAMPFSKEMEDIYFYGIQQPTRSAGFVCERVDQEHFTGDVLERIRERIESASLVIAELTGTNPNVYLEIGYAWGKERPTVLLVKEGETPTFDVQGHRQLRYGSIRHLAELLEQELKGLRGHDLSS